MKKKFYLLASLLCLCLSNAFLSCDESPILPSEPNSGLGGSIGGGSGSGSGSGGKTDTIVPGPIVPEDLILPLDAKIKLENVGREFMSEIKTSDHENLVDVTAFMVDRYEYFEVEEAYVDKVERLYHEDYEYYANPVRAVHRLMAKSLEAVQHAASLSTSIPAVWVASLQASLPDLYGGFTPDEENEIWLYNPSVNDRIEVTFTDDHNQKWVATLKGSKETTRVKLTATDKGTWEEVYEGGPDEGTTSDSWHDRYEYIVDVPKQLTFTVKCNNNSIVDLTLNSSLAINVDAGYSSDGRDYYYWCVDEWYSDGGWYSSRDSDYEYAYTLNVDYTNLNVDAVLKVNTYDETFKTEVTEQGVTASANVKIKGKQMLKSEAVLVANMDDIIRQATDFANEEDESKLDASAVKSFSVLVDIMGKVQVAGKCDKFEDLYDAVWDLEETDWDGDSEEFKQCIDKVNNTYSVTLHFDGARTVQAKGEFEIFKEEDEWNGEAYFGVRPVLVFAADDSRYSVEEYFTESSFSDLIEDATTLEENFEDMLDGYFGGH